MCVCVRACVCVCGASMCVCEIKNLIVAHVVVTLTV